MKNKRDIFSELAEGFDALKSQREGKLTPPPGAPTPGAFKNREQDRTKPKAQAAQLIRIVGQFPDMMQRLEAV